MNRRYLVNIIFILLILSCEDKENRIDKTSILKDYKEDNQSTKIEQVKHYDLLFQKAINHNDTILYNETFDDCVIYSKNFDYIYYPLLMAEVNNYPKGYFDYSLVLCLYKKLDDFQYKEEQILYYLCRAKTKGYKFDKVENFQLERIYYFDDICNYSSYNKTDKDSLKNENIDVQPL